MLVTKKAPNFKAPAVLADNQTPRSGEPGGRS